MNTSTPVQLYTGVLSIPVHLYTSHTNKRQYTSPPVYQSLRKAVYQSTCIPVTKKSRIPVHLVYQSLEIPVYQFASIPVAVVTTLPLLMSAPYESSPLAAVVYESLPLAAVVYKSSPLAAVIISTWTTSVPTALV